MVGLIRGARALHGQVRVRALVEPPTLLASAKGLVDENGAPVKVVIESLPVTGEIVVSIAGVTTREQAEALKGKKLFLPRAELPDPGEGAYYEADLQGLEARDAEGVALGSVVASHDYGAGAFVEIQPLDAAEPSFMLPFTAAYVPQVDSAQGFLVALVPEGWRMPVKVKTTRPPRTPRKSKRSAKSPVATSPADQGPSDTGAS